MRANAPRTAALLKGPKTRKTPHGYGVVETAWGDMTKPRDILRTIFDESNLGVLNSDEHNTMVLQWGGLFCALASLTLTVFNIVMGYWLMALTTAVLVICFSVACVLAHGKNFNMSRILMALACAFIFSFYAATGENEGFAILWILLIPILSMFLLGLRTGFILSLYFQIFLIVLFYTPLSAQVAGYYTSTMAMRFPVLYLADFGMVTFLMYERQKLYITTSAQATHDALTGLLNRRRADEVALGLGDLADHPNLCVVVLDINRLKWTNDNLGHEAGDELIIGAAQMMTAAFPCDWCFRTGGDEFLILCERADVTAELNELHRRLATWRGRLVGELSLSVGVASRAEFPDASYDELSKRADVRMYEDKASYYRQTQHDRRCQ